MLNLAGLSPKYRKGLKARGRKAPLLLDLVDCPGNPFLRGLLVEAAQNAVRLEPEARKLAVYWMLRLHVDYAQLIRGSHAGQPGTFRGLG
jgi:hypothetical protein